MKCLKLRTEIALPKLEAKIDYNREIFTIGSCFAQRIGDELLRNKFRATVNPTGTLFNPISICSTLERIAKCQLINEVDLLPFDVNDSNGGWYHYDFHSSLSASTKEATTQRINQTIERAHDALERSEVVVITLGTAWVYQLEGLVVANCHKQPARNFKREKLCVEQIVEQLQSVIERYLGGKKVVLTLSPIRHIADGLSENSLSKAILRVAIDELVQRNRSVEYFPAYEIMVDDLRDYRFYEVYMIHPSQLAVEYIWSLFCNSTMDTPTMQTKEKIEQIAKAASHRVQNPASQQHLTLCRRQIEAIEMIEKLNPKVDLSFERGYFSNFLEQ